MPQLTARIAEWGVRLQQRTIATIVQRVEVAFLLAADTVAVWYAVDGDRIVGHVLILEEERDGVTVGLISQLAIDPFAVPRPLLDTVWCEAEAWARSKGLDGLIFVTARWKLRAWREMFGFRPWKLIFRRDVAL